MVRHVSLLTVSYKDDTILSETILAKWIALLCCITHSVGDAH